MKYNPELKKMLILLGGLAAIIVLPYAGSLIEWSGNLPDNFFEYPPLSAPEKLPFNPLVFWALCGVGIIVALLYLVPGIFGFKKPVPSTFTVQNSPFPVWFWIGLVMWAAAIFVLWRKEPEPAWLINWSYLPLFWGFTLMVDGWIFKRTGGKSLIATVPHEMFAMAVSAMGGWMLFEYLNFFVDENWFYPTGNVIPDDEFLLYAILGSSGLMPPIFELYSLFRTFPGLRNKYSSGPKIRLPKWVLYAVLVGSLASLFAVGIMPEEMFGLLWVSPLLIFAVLLELEGTWTPFSWIGKGNYTPFALYALAYLVYGFLLEFWNYFSATHPPIGEGISYNPAHWVYSLSWVNQPHVWEMPLVGYLGYLPFGVYCAVWWFVFARLMNIKSHFVKAGIPGDPGQDAE